MTEPILAFITVISRLSPVDPRALTMSGEDCWQANQGREKGCSSDELVQPDETGR